LFYFILITTESGESEYANLVEKKSSRTLVGTDTEVQKYGITTRILGLDICLQRTKRGMGDIVGLDKD